jgi:hypothetical protein
MTVGFNVLVLVGIISLLVLGSLVYVGFYLHRSQRWPSPHFEHLLELWMHGGGPSKIDTAAVVGLVEEWHSRRNEFWTSYGQFMLSGFVIVCITILLLTKTITAEAGLPILAGIGGFAIGKGTSSRTSGPAGGGGNVG